MKKILAIGHNYYPELTGIGKYTAEFCNYLHSQKGFSVDVITGQPYYPQWKIFKGYKNSFKKENINGVTVYRTPLYIPQNPTGFRRLLQDGLFFSCVKIMIIYLLIFHRKKYDYIFIPVPSFILGFAGLFYRFFSRKTKVLYHIQDLQINAADNLGMLKSKLLVKTMYALERYILKHADHVSTISEGMREIILKKTNKLQTCLLFPNWINNENIFPVVPKPVIDKNNLHNKKIIFYSGAIGEKQGLEIILETAKFFAAREDFVFIISGEGPYKHRLSEQASKNNLTNILFYNLMPVAEFNLMLNAAFIHLVIQKEAGNDFFLPSKLTNILGIGGCVIVTAIEHTSLYEILTTHHCGYIIEPSDKNALCNAIINLDEDAVKRKWYSDNALSYANQFLYRDSVIDNYMVQTGMIN